MAQFLLLCLLILADAFMILTAQSIVEPNMTYFSNPPIPSPSKKGQLGIAAIRKLGKHPHKVVKSSNAPSSSPSEAPQTEENMHSREDVSSSVQSTETVQGQMIHVQKQHRSIDKSVAGGGVILGGLATTFLAAVLCYIRATGRRSAEPSA